MCVPWNGAKGKHTAMRTGGKRYHQALPLLDGESVFRSSSEAMFIAPEGLAL